ncbi:HEPN domain-containing protein [Streptomyces sp. NPDC020597]|uniref:HEPN domain-containing protein n=1 Tax=unclassified Streptomyces TaxID=2593676 RepID=UPI0037A6B4DB
MPLACRCLFRLSRRRVGLPTRRYKQLKSRVERLEQLFLPLPSPVGSYTPDEYDQVRAYIVLCHAEMEAYLEAMCLDVLRKAEDRWRSSASAGPCIAALLLYNDKKVSPPKSLAKQPPAEAIDVIITKAIKKHRDFTQEENHGIKEANLLRLLLPIGFQESDFDALSTWLATVNTFGVARGRVAHQSANRVRNPPDPSLARNQVSDVLDGLVQLEPIFAKLGRR